MQLLKYSGKKNRVGAESLLRLEFGFGALICLFLAVLTARASWAQADSFSWSLPVNISRSGVATEPELFIAGSDRDQIIGYWPENLTEGLLVQDISSGFARWQTGSWTDPTSLVLPFSGRPHVLLAGEGTAVHGLWIDQNAELNYQLSTASAIDNNFSWTSPTVLASGVVTFEAVVGPDDRVHVAYIRADDDIETRDGVFYRQSSPGGGSFQSPVFLYGSAYYRKYAGRADFESQAILDEPPQPNVSLLIAETENGIQRLVAWDNPGIKRIFLARTEEGSDEWGEPQELAGPIEESPYTTPHFPELFLVGNRILLQTRLFQSGGACAVAMQASTDYGLNWRNEQPPESLLAGCPLAFKHLGAIEDTEIFFLVNQQQQNILLGLNGRRWSNPQEQRGLQSFSNPDTFNFVQLGCLDVELRGNQLLALACDQAGGGDIWYSEREISDISEWFKSANSWTVVDSIVTELEPSTNLVLVVDSSGGAHAITTQTERGSQAEIASNFQYLGLQLGEIIGPFEILSNIEGIADQLDLIVDRNDRLVLAWRSGQEGELFFSSTSANRASARAGWFSAEKWFETESIGGSPSLVAFSEEINAAFTIPYNEGRGIYFTRLDGTNDLWAEPKVVFDAAVAGCPSVADVDLNSNSSGQFHLLWTCSSLPGGTGNFEALYANSWDGGESWSDVLQSWLHPARSAKVVAMEDGSIHALWEEQGEEDLITWHSVSLDGGFSWSEPNTIAFNSTNLGDFEVIEVDSSLLVYLRMEQVDSQQLILKGKVWNGRRWENLPDFTLAVTELTQLSSWAASSTPEGNLLVAFLGNNLVSRDPGLASQVVFSELELEVVAEPPEIDDVPLDASQNENTVATLTPTVEQSTTAEPTVMAIDFEDEPNDSGGLLGGPSMLVFLLAGGVLLGGGLLIRRRLLSVDE